MGEITVSQRENQTNSQQLDELKQDHDRRLQRIRNEYQRREAEARESGEAAVNHIRQSTEERVDHAKHDGDNKMRTQNELESRNYSDLKRRIQQNQEVLDGQAHQAEETTQRRIAQARVEEEVSLRKNNERIRDFMEQQKILKEQARSEANRSIEHSRETANNQLLEIQERSANEYKKTAEAGQKRLSDLKEYQRKNYEAAQLQASQRINDLDRESELKLTQDRNRKNESLKETEGKYRESLKSEEVNGQQRIDLTRKRDQDRLEKLTVAGLQRNEKLEREFSNESQRIELAGERDIANRQDKFDQLRKKQEVENKEELTKLKEDLSTQEQHQHKEVDARLRLESQKLDQGLKELNHNFKKRFDTDEKTYQGSLQNQKDTYLKALFKQKQKFDADFGKETARSNDPFYRLKSFDAAIEENPHSYVVKARVAPHERDSVNITVKDDKISISARRAYEDAFTDDQGNKTTTNSYQTHRQDFPLTIPVDGNKAIKRVADDGSITVIAPKKGYSTKA
jgi:Hsp20/alpha crystallin family